MCSNGLNFTKINKKRKELLTSIFARFGSQDTGNMQTAAAGAGGGVQGNNNVHVPSQVKKETK